MKQCDHALSQQLLAEAANSPRLRSHQLWHQDHQDTVQRMLLAAQPGSYVAAHQHTQQWECLIPVYGEVEWLRFNEQGTLLERRRLTPGDVLEMPAATIHTLVFNQPCCLFEVKPGPFAPSQFAEWAPQEGQAGVAEIQAWLTLAKPGERYAHP